MEDASCFWRIEVIYGKGRGGTKSVSSGILRRRPPDGFCLEIATGALVGKPRPRNNGDQLSSRHGSDGLGCTCVTMAKTVRGKGVSRSESLTSSKFGLLSAT
jgi:hypothetical protein